jgi:hypothetical protein
VHTKYCELLSAKPFAAFMTLKTRSLLAWAESAIKVDMTKRYRVLIVNLMLLVVLFGKDTQ